MSLFHHPDIERGVEVLRRGGLVAYPTDTLYGLGANAFNEKAVDRVYQAKCRPPQKAIPLLLASADDLHLVAEEIPDIAQRLASSFWPGALTLILKSSSRIPRVVTGRGDKVAVRVPDHPVPRELMAQLGAPITGTSANVSGGPSPLSADLVLEQLGEMVDLIIDCGPCPGDQPSTVVDVSGERPGLIREGAIPKEVVEEVCGALIEPNSVA